MVTEWISDFQAAHWQPDEDVVFDVLCGDFNFDNCSPGVFFFQKNVFKKKSPVCCHGVNSLNLLYSFYLLFSVHEDDVKEQNHCLFEQYKDPCRAAPGKEKPWVIGAGRSIFVV